MRHGRSFWRLLLLIGCSTAAAADTAPGAGTGAAPTATCRTVIRSAPDHRTEYFQNCPDTPEMVSFRGGRYLMGDAAGAGRAYEQPVHEVTLGPFAIGRYEVTRAEWQACIAAAACSEPTRTPQGEEAGSRYPVASVSWLQAGEYVSWLTQHTGHAYRLPSESEWEYAARAGATGSYPWNPNQPEQVACKYANLMDLSGMARHPEMGWMTSCDDGYGEAAPVGSLRPNAWGLYDMQGNVWEWVEDCWHPNYAGAPADGSAWTTGSNCRKRVNRGGGWGNGLGTLRLSNRDADPADSHSDGLGFRVAMSLARSKLPPTPATPPQR